VLVEYCAWFLLPVALVAALAVWRQFASPSSGSESTSPAGQPSAKRATRIALVIENSCWLLLFLESVAYGAWMLGVPWLMPYLPWFFEILKLLGLKAEIPATALTIVGGVLFAHFFIRRYLPAGFRPTLEQGMLDAATFVSLLMALVFFVFGDKDVLIFLPLAAIAVGKQAESVLLAHRRSVFVACVLLLAGAAVWTRGDLSRNQAVWTLAERVQARGVPSERIFAGWEWYGYHHFEDYVRAFPPSATVEFANFFGPWMDRQRAQAEYLIVHDPEPPADERWEIVDRFQYFSVFSRGIETFYAVQKVR
jgi:hypothetical protein